MNKLKSSLHILVLVFRRRPQKILVRNYFLLHEKKLLKHRRAIWGFSGRFIFFECQVKHGLGV